MVELLYSRCAGLDVHKKGLSACIRISDGSDTRKQTATFRTFTADLERLCRWLEEHRVNQWHWNHRRVLDSGVEHSGAQ